MPTVLVGIGTEWYRSMDGNVKTMGRLMWVLNAPYIPVQRDNMSSWNRLLGATTEIEQRGLQPSGPCGHTAGTQLNTDGIRRGCACDRHLTTEFVEKCTASCR